MKILNNYVLIQPEYERYEQAVGFLLDTSYEVQKHAPTSGIVVGIPKKLNYVENPIEGDALMFKTTMDLSVGDRVIFGYNAIEQATKSGRTVGDFVLLRYDTLFCAIRGKKIIMLNGYVIVEAVEERTDNDLVPDYLNSVNNFTKGKILYIGSGNMKYRFYPEIGGDTQELKKNQFVLFNLQYSIPLQYKMHSIIDSTKELYRMQQKDISAIISEIIW